MTFCVLVLSQDFDFCGTRQVRTTLDEHCGIGCGGTASKKSGNAVKTAPEGAEIEGFEAGLLQSHRCKLIAFSQSESFFQTLSVLLNAKILAVGTCTNTVTATKECNGKWSVVVMGKNHVFGNVQ